MWKKSLLIIFFLFTLNFCFVITVATSNEYNSEISPNILIQEIETGGIDGRHNVLCICKNGKVGRSRRWSGGSHPTIEGQVTSKELNDLNENIRKFNFLSLEIRDSRLNSCIDCVHSKITYNDKGKMRPVPKKSWFNDPTAFLNIIGKIEQKIFADNKEIEKASIAISQKKALESLNEWPFIDTLKLQESTLLKGDVLSEEIHLYFLNSCRSFIDNRIRTLENAGRTQELNSAFQNLPSHYYLENGKLFIVTPFFSSESYKEGKLVKLEIKKNPNIFDKYREDDYEVQKWPITKVSLSQIAMYKPISISDDVYREAKKLLIENRNIYFFEKELNGTAALYWLEFSYNGLPENFCDD